MSLRLNITPNTDVLYVILPGVSQGSAIGVLKTIADKLELASKTWLSVSFPFQDKGLNKPESVELEAEIEEVLKGLAKISNEQKFKRIIIIGKSFGALIAVKLFPYLCKTFECPIELHVLGYIFDDAMSINEHDYEKLFIYQGEHDRFGSPADVREKLPFAKIFPIVNADHSYRNEMKEPVYEEVVCQLLFSNMTI